MVWRFKYGKYKAMRAGRAGNCTACRLKRVHLAYRVLCDHCARSSKLCPGCNKPPALAELAEGEGAPEEGANASAAAAAAGGDPEGPPQPPRQAGPIDARYQVFDIDDVLEQYVSAVRAVSSFWGAPPSSGYHALNVAGPPGCLGVPGECSSAGALPFQQRDASGAWLADPPVGFQVLEDDTR